ncbi:MAG: hypothetical protein D6790_17950 [Caldilineae bacterium]|nr:MAG: hypothetical protein D6790_17950 [Caldilineae bacterium]
MHVRLFWQPTGRLDADLHSFLHIYTPGQKRSWAVTQNMNPGGIPTSSWLPSLYYVDDLRVTAPEDRPPASFTLAESLADVGGGPLFVPDSEDGLIYLGEIGFQPLKAGWRQRVQAQTATPARFGEELTLQGYDLLAAPGGPILRLFWAPTRTPAADYTLFVHLYAPDGTRIAQYDGPPLAGLVPTSGWQPEGLYIDRRVLPLPGDLTGGTYTFQVGLYRADTGERLPIFPEPQVAGHFSGDALLVPLVIPE